MLRIAICDDSPVLLEKMQEILQKYQDVSRHPFGVHAYQNAVDLLDGLKKTCYDILFLDIIIPGFSGMEAAHEIRTFNKEIKIVFLTSSAEFAIESYDVDAYYYLLKPVSEDLLFPLLDKMFTEIENQEASCVVYAPTGVVRLPFSKVECLEIYNKHLVFHLSDGGQFEIRGSLTEYEATFLDKPEFLKIHRSYLMNMDYIQSMETGVITACSGKKYPVSRLLSKDIRQKYMDYMFMREV